MHILFQFDLSNGRESGLEYIGGLFGSQAGVAATSSLHRNHKFRTVRNFYLFSEDKAEPLELTHPGCICFENEISLFKLCRWGIVNNNQ